MVDSFTGEFKGCVMYRMPFTSSEPLTDEQKALLADLRANLDKVMDAASVISYEAM